MGIDEPCNIKRAQRIAEKIRLIGALFFEVCERRFKPICRRGGLFWRDAMLSQPPPKRQLCVFMIVGLPLNIALGSFESIERLWRFAG